MKKLSFGFVVLMFVFGAFSASAATVYNHSYCSESADYAFDCDTSFSWIGTCAGGDDPCYHYMLVDALSVDIKTISVYIAVSKYSPLSSNNWYYWDSTDRSYHDDCTFEGEINENETWKFYVGYQSWSTANHTIGTALCPEGETNRAITVYFQTDGDYYWRMFSGQNIIC